MEKGALYIERTVAMSMEKRMALKFDVDTRLQPSLCCECGARLDACAGPCHPSPGDVTICAYCACTNVFGEDLQLRSPTDGEVFALAADRDFQVVRRAAESVIKKKAAHDH